MRCQACAGVFVARRARTSYGADDELAIVCVERVGRAVDIVLQLIVAPSMRAELVAEGLGNWLRWGESWLNYSRVSR